MKRVVITGMGIHSCIGNTLEDVTHSLQNGISGTRLNPVYQELNFKSHVSAAAVQDFDKIDRRAKRFMGVCAMYAYNAAMDAVQNAGLTVEQLGGNPRYGIAGGSGGNSTASVAEVVKKTIGLKAYSLMRWVRCAQNTTIPLKQRLAHTLLTVMVS